MAETRTAIILGGGSGVRMKSKTPKQFLILGGLPVIMHSILAFYRYDDTMEIVVVLPESHKERWLRLCEEHSLHIIPRLEIGGQTRFHSVQNGLSGINHEGLVAIHDGVRPLVEKDMIHRCFNEAQMHGNAIPVVDPSESLRRLDETSSSPLIREQVKLVQTPQVFSVREIIKAYKKPWQKSFTDDATVAEANGVKIHLVEGDHMNIKITHPQDLVLAETILASRQKNQTKMR